MKKLLLASLAFGLFLGAANAQPPAKGKQQRENKGAAMKEKKSQSGQKENSEWRGHRGDGQHNEDLNLSESQKSEVARINENFRTQMQALKSQNLSREERKSRMKELQTQHVQSIRAVLNEQQRARFDEKQMKKQDQEPHSANKGNRKAKQAHKR